VTVFGRLIGTETFANHIMLDLYRYAGPQVASFAASIISEAHDFQTSLVASIFGVSMIIVGAIGIFGQVKTSLDKIFGVEESGVVAYMRSQALAFSAVVLLGAVMVLSIVVSAVIPVIVGVFGTTNVFVLFIYSIGNSASTLFAILLIASIYRYFPSRRIKWSSAFIGSAITIVLFIVGRYLIAYYLAYAAATSVYGTAGIAVIVLLWAYYSAHIFFFGAAWAVSIEVDRVRK
jgi:membrane protein